MCKVQSEGEIAAFVASLVENLLGSPVALDQPLMEAGLDSLGAVELRNSLTNRFNIDLPASVIFDYPSVGALSRLLSASAQPQRMQLDNLAGVQIVAKDQNPTGGLACVVAIACRYPGGIEGDLLSTRQRGTSVRSAEA